MARVTVEMMNEVAEAACDFIQEYERRQRGNGDGDLLGLAKRETRLLNALAGAGYMVVLAEGQDGTS